MLTRSVEIARRRRQDSSWATVFQQPVRELINQYFLDSHSIGAFASEFPNCGRDASGIRKPEQFDITSPLQGSLHLEESIEDGLAAIDRAKIYDVYGQTSQDYSGLAILDVRGVGAGLSEKKVPQFQPPTSIISPAATTIDRFSLLGPLGIASDSTTFGSNVDFNLTLVGGIGPSLSIATEKWGAGSGGNAGTGNQLFNANRNTQDSLSITFVPSCRSETTPSQISSLSVDHQSKEIVITFFGSVKSEATTTPRPFKFGITLEPDSTDVAADNLKSYSPNAKAKDTLTFFNDDLSADKVAAPDWKKYIGAPIQWSGYMDAVGDYSFRGIVKDRFDAPIGQIWLKGRWDYTYNVSAIVNNVQIGEDPKIQDRFYFPAGIFDAVKGNNFPANYWDTIQRCDVTTASQKQGSIDSAKSRTDSGPRPRLGR